MIGGRYDFTFPQETSQVPMFNDLGTADKRHILFECGHGVPFKQAVEAADKWLREQLGSPQPGGPTDEATRTGHRRDAPPPRTQ
jgi:hypothetical protein